MYTVISEGLQDFVRVGAGNTVASPTCKCSCPQEILSGEGSYRNTVSRNWQDYNFFWSATEYQTLGIIASKYKNVVLSPVIFKDK